MGLKDGAAVATEFGRGRAAALAQALHQLDDGGGTDVEAFGGLTPR